MIIFEVHDDHAEDDDNYDCYRVYYNHFSNDNYYGMDGNKQVAVYDNHYVLL